MNVVTGLIGTMTIAAAPAAMVFAPTPSHFVLACVLFVAGAALCIASFINRA